MSSIVQISSAAPFWEYITSLEEASSDATDTPLVGLFGAKDNFCGARRTWGPSNANNTGFSPAADVFDTTTSYVVHVSLPGAKKEDVGINYDEGKSEIQISGVVHRNGNEEFLKMLVIRERNVGLFEKKIRLGTLRTPAFVDSDGITAKLEDGVLEVIIPKKEKEAVKERKIQID